MISDILNKSMVKLYCKFRSLHAKVPRVVFGEIWFFTLRAYKSNLKVLIGPKQREDPKYIPLPEIRSLAVFVPFWWPFGKNCWDKRIKSEIGGG